jgi:hypothetical protein
MLNGLLVTDSGDVAVVGAPKPTKVLLDTLFELRADLEKAYLHALAESLDENTFKQLMDMRITKNANESELPDTES